MKAGINKNGVALAAAMLCRTMTYTTHNTVNRLVRKQLHLNHVVNLVPRVSHLTALGGKMRDPGNEVAMWCQNEQKEE